MLSPLCVWAAMFSFVVALHAQAGWNYYHGMPIVQKADQSPSPGWLPAPSPTASPPSPVTPPALPPNPTQFVREPLPSLLKHRVVAILLVSNHSQKEPGVMPQALQRLHQRFGNDLLRTQIYVVGVDRTIAWKPAGPTPPVVRPFADDQYETAIAAGFAASDRLVPPEFRSQYSCVMIWQSPVNPDQDRKLILESDDWRGRDYFIWSSRSAGRSMEKLRSRFPGRIAGLDTTVSQDPTELAGFVQSLLKKPSSPLP